MPRFDVVRAVEEGRGWYQFFPIELVHEGNRLVVYVFRDAMRFDGVPAMRWDRTPIAGDTRLFDGVRLPASADELQKIADLVGCLMLTPLLADIIWERAGRRFNPVINSGAPVHQIVALTNIHDVHLLVEQALHRVGGDDGESLISCEGKYWVLCRDMDKKAIVQGDHQAFNYGWQDEGAPTTRKGVLPGVKVWQNLAGAHNKLHFDPSQTIRLGYRWAKILRPGSDVWQDIETATLLHDPVLSYAVSHEGPLDTTRQPGVPDYTPPGTVFLPVLEVAGQPSDTDPAPASSPDTI